MSVHFTLRCLLCDVDGPDIRLSNGITWVDKRAVTWEDAMRDGSDWAHDFLRKHQYHGGAFDDDGYLVSGGLVLVHEQSAANARFAR